MSLTKLSILHHKSMSAQTGLFVVGRFSNDSSMNPASLHFTKFDDFSLFFVLHHVFNVFNLLLAPLGLPGRLWVVWWRRFADDSFINPAFGHFMYIYDFAFSCFYSSFQGFWPPLGSSWAPWAALGRPGGGGLLTTIL